MREKIVYRLSMGFTQSELDWIENARQLYEEAVGVSLSANQAIKALLFESRDVTSISSPVSNGLEVVGDE